MLLNNTPSLTSIYNTAQRVLSFNMDTQESTGPATKAHAGRIQKAKPHLSAAGRWNADVLRRLATELEQNPETDICKFLSPRYSKKLWTLKGKPPS